MLGIFVMALFMIFGVLQSVTVFEKRSMTIKIWLGMTMGFMEMMWFPSIFAYIFDFTMTAQVAAVMLAAVLAAVSCVLRARKGKT